jgi:glutaminyl-tRNA synthetase
VTEVRCTYDPETKSGSSRSGRKVKATIHWVSAAHAIPAEVRLYNHLFAKEDPDDLPEGADWRVNLNPQSLETLRDCRLEAHLAAAVAGSTYQFERLGYFCVDALDSSTEGLVFNRTITLRDTWAKIERGGRKA